jgi:hypothetical protein
LGEGRAARPPLVPAAIWDPWDHVLGKQRQHTIGWQLEHYSHTSSAPDVMAAAKAKAGREPKVSAREAELARFRARRAALAQRFRHRPLQHQRPGYQRNLGYAADSRRSGGSAGPSPWITDSWDP